jgi:histidyl-tRNA synthetase
LGQRNPEEVVDRLLRKVRGTDDESSLRRGLEVASDLATIRGEPGPAMEAVLTVLRGAGADTAPWDRLNAVLDLLLMEPGIAGNMGLDFGLVGGLAYYNGVIFEINHPQSPSGLGGGGRYDGLARALGSPKPVPALGFAFNLEALLHLTHVPDSGGVAVHVPPGALVLAIDSSSHREALRACRELRQQGIQSEFDIEGRGLPEALKYAAAKGIAQVVVVDQDGQRTSHQL